MTDKERDDIAVSLATIAERLTTIAGKIESHDHFINGNSMPGAKQRLSAVEGFINQRRRFEWLILGCIVAAAMSGIASAAVYIVRSIKI